MDSRLRRLCSALCGLLLDAALILGVGVFFGFLWFWLF